MTPPPIRRADLLLTGGTIFTGNPRQARAEAVAVRGNRIIAVGTAAGLAPLRGRATRVVELAGRFACAGFNDSHTHLMMGGQTLQQADLTGAANREDLLARLRMKATTLAPGDWLLGFGWDQEMLGEWPRRDWLDEEFPGRPALLMRVDSHIGWASSEALARAGVDEATPAPAGGEFARDGAGIRVGGDAGAARGAAGRLTGILKERAVEQVAASVPPPSETQRRSALEAALAELRRNGITSVHDLSGEEALQTLSDLRAEGRLTVRVAAWAPLAADLGPALALRERFLPSDPLIRLNTLKGFVDGTLGASTAALLAPYADARGVPGASDATLSAPSIASTGAWQWDEPTLSALVRRAHQQGFQVTLHAIGDAAVHRALAAFDGTGGSGRVRRHRIEHAEVVAPGDIGRFARTGVVASMQPSQMLSDGAWLARRLGPERLSRCFPWRELLDHGASVIFGTDWPVEPLSPMRSMRAATAPHTLPSVARASDWRAGRQFTPWEALSAMTHWPAHATFEEDLKGTLAAGRLADIVVLSGNPLETPAGELESLKVDLTVFDGRVIYAADPLQ